MAIAARTGVGGGGVIYPIAPNGIFQTYQGEGVLLGTPMVFVRLAGCSIGCAGCDTNYSVDERLSVQEIRQRVESVRGNAQWVFVTGGEPADHNLWPLLNEMRCCGRVALVTSGSKPLAGAGKLIDFLSVSPHSTTFKLLLTRGDQINLVPGLNGLRLSDWNDFDARGFAERFVTPLWGTDADECVNWINARQGWRLGVQAHKYWGMP